MLKYFIAFICVNFQIIAQDSTINQLETLTVTANIIGSSLSQTARNISIIDSKTISLAPVKTLDGILQHALNVDVRTRSSAGVQADISIRGGHYDQTLIMLDGIKLNDPQTGHHSLNLPIDISNIERIEVLQGGASRVFGPSAFSGIINIISKKITKNSVMAQIGMGQYKFRDYLLSGKAILKNSYFGITGNLNSSTGYTQNTQYDKRQWSGLIGQNLKNGYVELGHSQFSNKFGASNFYSPKFYNQYEEVASTVSTFKLINSLSKSLSSTFLASYRIHTDVYDFDNYRNISGKLGSVNFHKTNVLDVEYKVKKISKIGTFGAGLEYRSEAVLSNRLGETLTKTIAIPNRENVFYTKSKSRNNSSAFIEYNKLYKKIKISTGSLLNYNSQFGAAIYPGFDISYLANNSLTPYASVNKSLRYPTFTELYLVGSTVVGDPNLKPEKAISYETGLKNTFKYLSGSVSIFYNKTTDAIDKIKRPDKPVPTMENIDDINMLGLEINQAMFLNKILKSKVLQKFTFSYSRLKADRKEDNFQSFYTLNYLKHKASVGLEMNILPNLNFSTWYNYKYREGNYQLDKSSPVINYKPVKLLDSRLSYHYKFLSLNIDINNITNQEYYEFGFVKQPGRWLTTGIMLKL